MRTLRLFAVLVTLLIPGALSYAQSESCGIITGPSEIAVPDEDIGSVPITNCSNPFNVTEGIASPFTLSIEGVDVVAGTPAVIPVGGTRDYRIRLTGEMTANIAVHAFYRHDGNDYEFVDTEPTRPSRVEYERFAREFLSDEEDRDFFVDAAVSSDDPVFETEEQEDLYYEFLDYVNGEYDSVLPLLEAGTYTLLSRQDYVFLNYRTPLKRLFDFIIPTAYAEYSVPSIIHTLTFTLQEQAPEGASSVLFLPGIQASRLYKDGLLGTEDQVWPPNALLNNDVRDLSMTASGESEEDIYTRDVIDQALGIGSVYGGFLEFLENQKTATLPIKNYQAFAYDWRFDVSTIAEEGTLYEDGVRDVVDTVSLLAGDSCTGKVTIIAHSNGGLVAKALLRRLEAEGRAGIIDKLIFIGTPHLGTPKAIGTLLHGYDQTDALGGFVIDGLEVRRVVNNMPGVYGLLPSLEYLEGLTAPIISFEDGSTTEAYRALYGDTISTELQYKNFMYGSDLLDRGFNESIATPVRVNAGLFDEALLQHEEWYDNWEAPQNVAVVEIVGVGLPTVQSLTYRTVTEQKCTAASGQVICVDKSEIKPFANMSRWGDGTVVERSADGYLHNKQSVFVDLLEMNKGRRLAGKAPIEHYNMTESDEVQSTLVSLIAGTTPYDSNYILQNRPSVTEEWTLETIDSPVRVVAVDKEGNKSGVEIEDGVKKIYEEIPGSQYFEFGDTKYLIIPKAIERTVRLYGEERGGYSLQVADIQSDDTVVVRSKLLNATVTPTMVAEYERTSDGYSPLKTDLEGDGVFELVSDLNGQPVSVPVMAYEALIKLVQTSGLQKGRMTALLVIIRNAERVSESNLPLAVRERLEQALLSSAVTLVENYIKRGQISVDKGEEITSAINVLKNEK